MGQKAHPTGQRLGFIKGWDSNWYGGKNYADKLVEDEQIRKYLIARLKKASVSKIVIERTLKLVTVTINTARPGVIIGKGGTEVDKLREELKKLTGKDVQINIFEIKRPELDCLLYTSDAADERSSVDLGGRRIIKKKPSIVATALRRAPLPEQPLMIITDAISLADRLLTHDGLHTIATPSHLMRSGICEQ
mgnify:CR=1 FL=1